MNFISLIVSGLMLLPLPNGDGDGDKKKKGKDQYYRYETEDVNLYRDRTNFTMPEITVEIPSTDEQDEVSPVSLNYLFSGGKKLHVQSDSKLNDLIQAHKYINSRKETMSGFRVQLYAGRGESGARRQIARAMNLFPDHQSYLTFNSPNYVVKVGDFLDKEEAFLFTRKLREFFPDAFPVPAKVKIPKYRPDDEE